MWVYIDLVVHNCRLPSGFEWFQSSDWHKKWTLTIGLDIVEQSMIIKLSYLKALRELCFIFFNAKSMVLTCTWA